MAVRTPLQLGALPIISTIIAIIGTLIATSIVIRLVYIQNHMKKEKRDLFNYVVITSTSLFTFVAISVTTTFVVHLINNTPLEQEDGYIHVFVLDYICGFAYVLSMAAMDAVFLIRIELIFPPDGIFEGVSRKRVRQLWFAIAILVVSCWMGIVCDMLRLSLLAYIIGSIYVALLFGLSSYLLYIFITKLRLYYARFGTNTSAVDYKENAIDLNLYKLIIKTTTIAQIAIYSTLISMTISCVLNMLLMFSIVHDDGSYDYVERVILTIDCVIGAAAISFTMPQNTKIYNMIFGCVEQRYMIKTESKSYPDPTRSMPGPTSKTKSSGDPTSKSSGDPTSKSSGDPSRVDSVESL